MTTILLVDDDMELAATLAVGLRSQGFDVARTATGEGAVFAAERDHPSIILLDLGLPGLGGMEVLRNVRSWSSVPIIVLSARDDEPSKIAALEAGADDYVTKPFGIGELTARVNAALRRGIRADGQVVIASGDLLIDLSGKRVARADGSAVGLTATEWRLLEVLISREGEAVPHALLLRQVWGPEYETSVEYLRVYVGAIRRKLGAQVIATVAGTGYRFDRVAPT